MIIQNEKELFVKCNGGVKDIKKGDYYIPHKSNILCECDDCKNFFIMNYNTAKDKNLHFCKKCRRERNKNGMYKSNKMINIIEFILKFDAEENNVYDAIDYMKEKV
jgi:hypothetical protein